MFPPSNPAESIKRYLSTLARGQLQPQKATKFIITLQTITPSHCPEWVKADISTHEHTLGVFLNHTLKCTIKPMEMAAQRQLTENRSLNPPRTVTGQVVLCTPVEREVGLQGRAPPSRSWAMLHSASVVKVGFGAKILQAV